MRKNYYVYLHKTKEGQIFYVGKGTGERAWSRDRHPAWNKYVNERLLGEFNIEIYQNNMTHDEALEVEDLLINAHGKNLVNWNNGGREFDYDAIKRFHELRDKNRVFVSETKNIEANDLTEAVKRYREALDRMREYESITLEHGLIADLNFGPNWGDINILESDDFRRVHIRSLRCNCGIRMGRLS